MGYGWGWELQGSCGLLIKRLMVLSGAIAHYLAHCLVLPRYCSPSIVTVFTVSPAPSFYRPTIHETIYVPIHATIKSGYQYHDINRAPLFAG